MLFCLYFITYALTYNVNVRYPFHLSKVIFFTENNVRISMSRHDYIKLSGHTGNIWNDLLLTLKLLQYNVTEDSLNLDIYIYHVTYLIDHFHVVNLTRDATNSNMKS